MVGFLVAFCGTVMAVGTFWADAFVAPSLARAEPGLLDTPPTALAAGFTLSYGTVALGWLLFGWATLRVGFFPRGVIDQFSARQEASYHQPQTARGLDAGQMAARRG